jgi:hypothetical protein
VEHGRVQGRLGGEGGGGLGVGAARGIASCPAAACSPLGDRRFGGGCQVADMRVQGFCCLQGVRRNFEMEGGTIIAEQPLLGFGPLK